MSLSAVPFVIVDTETTGTKAGRDRLLEIGAVRLVNGTIEDRFSALINPERSVPARITKLTGITTGMVFDRPTVEEVLPAFLAFLGDDVFVAHNVSFDKRFLNAALKRTGHEPMANDTLCTLRLARRLLTGLRSKGLSALIDFYGIQIEARHRARGDAEATAVVLERLLRHVTFEHEIDTLEGLLAFQYRTYATTDAQPEHIRTIRTEVLPDLPARPGVYFMKDRRGSTIYIGKAKRLSDRVRSYFRGTGAQPPRTQKLLKAVRSVTWEAMDSEVEALLAESRLIKQHKPRFNRAQRRYRNRPFIKLDLSHEAPTVSYVPYIDEDEAEYYGPLAGRKQAELVLEVISRVYPLRECEESQYRKGERCLYADLERCTAPCVDGPTAAYTAAVNRVRAFLKGQDREVLTTLEAKMHEAADALAFEEASRYRDMLQRVERMLRRQEVVAAPILKHHAVVLEPGAAPDTWNVLCIRFGQLEEVLVVPAAFPPEAMARLEARLAVHFDPSAEQPAPYRKPEVDALRLVAQWLHGNRDTLRQIRWHPNLSPSALAHRIRTRALESTAEEPPQPAGASSPAPPEAA